jgi:hypothetical protein
MAGSPVASDAIYAAALREYESGKRRDGLWARALVASKGEAGRQESEYIRALVEQMAKEEAQAAMQRDPAAARRARAMSLTPGEKVMMIGALAGLILLAFVLVLVGN